jgi:formamidopyrimidine-DNA glycosylase
MPELPDIVAYQEAIERVAKGSKLAKARIYRPFLIRSVSPPISELEGKKLVGVHRIGKRIVLEFDESLYMVVHLMIAGRFSWLPASPRRPSKTDLAAFDFETGTLLLTEAGTKRRASIHVVQGQAGLKEHSRGGLEPFECSLEEFQTELLAENRTLKRALTNPSRFSGIGNAYSDEILFAARLSPVRLTQALNQEEIGRLYRATTETLNHWVEVLRRQFVDKFPGRGEVTAFRSDFNVHGRFGKPCRICSMPIQRIVYSENETNYCARCQNEDRVLADRALSRLLKSDWPRSIEEMAGD